VELQPGIALGFVLQASYRIEAGRPVVLLSGRLRTGGPFLVRERRQVPHFHVLAAQAVGASRLGAQQQRASDRLTLDGRPLVRVEVAVPAEVPRLRDRLSAAGIACFEADVRFAQRFLIDRGIRGALGIAGPWREEPGVGRVFEDPELESAEWTPALSVLSIDVETDPTARRLLSIALHGCGVSEVLLVTPTGWTCPEDATPCLDEAALLRGFARRVRELDPDVLTGWNVVDFDLAMLDRVAARVKVPLELGRGPGGLRLRPAGGARGGLQASVPGRVVLDGIALLRDAFIRREDHSLDAVARDVLGEGKTLHGPDRASEILRRFREDRPAFVEYNRTDARLALQVLERLRLVELAVARSLATGLTPDRVAASIAAFDSLYLARLGRRGRVAPSVEVHPGAEPQSGGHVLEPLPGLHRNVLVFDFRSLYPSLIRTFQIDPLNLVREGEPDDVIEPPGGAAFRRQRSILCEILDELLPQREAARRGGDAVKSQALKILMNSFYGVLGTPACRFYDPRLANAITGTGRAVLLWCRDWLEAAGHRVLYGDTDSLFVLAGEPDPAVARALGERLVAEVGQALSAHLQERYRVESRLQLVFERLYLRLYLPAVRHGTAGARKRYAGLADGPRGPQVVFTGLEAVRGDWTALAREVQRELFSRLFTDRPVEDYLRSVIAEVRAGRRDADLVYRKVLRKAPADYTANTPPHVAAARKLHRKGRGRVAYVITRDGPEPAEQARAPLDHQHYVEKQIQPIAEPVLALLGLDFAAVSGEPRQLSLF
jgi:DNA polymerase-2